MFIECKTNSGFEDQLTTNGMYQVKGLGENSFYIINDQGEKRWYGFSHFTIAKVSV